MISNPARKETADAVAKCRSVTNKPHATWLFPCFLYAVLIVGFSVSKQQPFSEENIFEMLCENVKLVNLIFVVSVEMVDVKVTELSPCISEYSVSTRLLEDTAH